MKFLSYFISVIKEIYNFEQLNPTTMKRKLVIVASFILITLAFSSCEDTCKICKKVYYDGSGAYLREDAEAEYCGAELLLIDGKTVNLGSLGTATWECR